MFVTRHLRPRAAREREDLDGGRAAGADPATAATDGRQAKPRPDEHRFCVPTIAPLPPRTVVESREW